MQPAGADVLLRLIHAAGDIGQRLDSIGTEVERDSVGGEQGLVLQRERTGGFRQNSHEVVAGQVLQLHANGEASLQFGHQVGRATAMESPGGDEQNLLGGEAAVSCLHGGAFDDGEQIPLDALPADIGPAFAIGGHADLVDFVEKDDAGFLGQPQRFVVNGLAVHQ